MWIERALMQRLEQVVVPGKVVALFGPRRVGKTELMRQFLSKQQNYLFVSGEDIFVREAFSSQSIDRLSQAVGTKGLLVIDEAQFVPNIGLNLKLLVDHPPELRILVSG